ncbi:hypothetical protein H5410_031532 [Solanum commersonii]|uniref:Plant bHLH transcription factor ACT-like domain-containing protein n=1 Tax=Solanum commersonii TaxID=4109 RepID=A0A9J5YIK3_SOLCO|nr:hypothetical protein H5410_031532 [Solanum commersonii]
MRGDLLSYYYILYLKRLSFRTEEEKNIKSQKKINIMVSREQKRASVLHDKLQLLRSITKSHALSDSSIIVDASKYIQELKHKVERLNEDITTTTTPQTNSNNKTSSWPQIEVETLEKGFLVNVYSERSCPGLLVSILQVLEDLGLNVLEARVSCTDTFRLQAFGGEDEEAMNNAQVVTEAIFEAIKNWSESKEQG